MPGNWLYDGLLVHQKSSPSQELPGIWAIADPRGAGIGARSPEVKDLAHRGGVPACLRLQNECGVVWYGVVWCGVVWCVGVNTDG